MSECEVDNVDDFSLDYVLGGSLETKPELPISCLQCQKEFTEPVVLNCLHVFDRNCLLSYENTEGIFPTVTCPKCGMQSGSLSSLQSYYTQYALDSNESKDNETEVNEFKCVLCTSGEEAKYKCTDCAGLLCERCKALHKEVKFLSSHLEVTDLTENDRSNITSLKKYLSVNKPVKCDAHPERKYSSYCIQCGMIACALCVNVDHNEHSTVLLEEFPKKISVSMSRYIENCKNAENTNKTVMDKLNSMLIEVNNSLDENKTHIEEVCSEWKNAIDEVKNQFLHKNKEVHNELEMKIMNSLNKSEQLQEHIEYSLEFTRSYLDRCSNVEYCKVIKTVIECLRELAEKHVDADLSTNVSFKENNSSIVNIIHNNFGVFVNSDDFSSKKCSSEDSGNLEVSELANCMNSLTATDPLSFKQAAILQNNSNQFKSQGVIQNGSKPYGDSNSLSPSTPYPILSMNSPMDLMGSVNSGDLNFNFPSYDNRCNFDDNQPSGLSMLPATTHTSPLSFPTIDTFSSSGSNGFLRAGTAGFNPNNRPPFPNRGNQCSIMTVKARWGSLGSGCGEMSSPHGFCLGFQEEIVVADTQNHRIQIFNKEGQFLSQFGVAGRDEGQLWFPRKVAILRSTQRYVVCDRGNERSRMQIFGRSGHFLRKISIRYIDIVAGLAVNSMGHIVAVDSVSPSVFVVSEAGELIKWFDCSSCMREPSDIAVHGDEYYICDFKGHCVCVFKQDGTFVQRFGNETITNFPNGIDVSDHGDILVGDSHGNRFHIAIYSRDGKLMSEFECPSVKVSRACGLKITSEGYLVTLAKNNHHLLVMDTLYIS